MSELYEDLLIDSSESFEDGNYFLVTITELELAKPYRLQFKWKYKDGTLGKDWSAVYNVTTLGSTVPLEPDLDAGDVVGGAGFISVTWNGNDASNNPIQNIDRVDIHIAGTSFGDGTKPAGNFKTAGTQTFSAEPGIYIVQLKAIRVDGTTSFFSSGRTVTVTAIEETIEAPVVPTGFTARAILGGLEISWNGTYTGGTTWSGFQAVNIYAGTSTSATGGTYIKVGQMTANKVSNKIVIPIDGTYVRYGFPAYIHVSSVNKATPPVESSISANVASATPSQVVNTDLINEVINEAKLALNAVTETKIANDAITTPKIVSGAITAAKIAALTITADQIAANTIDVGKLAANTISVGNLSAGDINATSFIRAGSSGSARVEIASTTVGSVLPGLTVYDSGGNQMLRAPLSGGLTITGALTATSISTSSNRFSVDSSGFMTATSANIDGTIKATAGFIGGTTSGIYIASGAIQNDASGSQFKIDNTGKARFGSATGNAIVIDPTSGNGGYYIYHTTGGQTGSASGVFSISTSGEFRSTSGVIGGWTIGSTTLTGGSTTLNSNGTISGATISGGVLRTTNQRIRINDTADQITFHPSSASNIGRLYMSSTSTVGQLLLEAPYNSTRAFLQMDTFGDTPSVELSAATGTVQLTGNIVRLNSVGNFYTGSITSDPASQTAGSYMGFDGQLNVRRSGDTPLHVHRYTGSGNRRMLTFYLSGSGAGGINADGSVAPTFASPSDYRLKENIRDFVDASSIIKKAKLKVFNFKNNPDIDVVGFIAHELAEVDPRLATGVKDEVDENGDPVYQDAMAGGLITYLTGALKETILKVEELQQRLDALEG